MGFDIEFKKANDLLLLFISERESEKGRHASRDVFQNVFKGTEVGTV